MKYFQLSRITILSAVLLSLLFLYLSVVLPVVYGSGNGGAVLQAKEDQAAASRPVFKSISPAVAAELIDRNEKILIVDVRTPQERKQFRIADSLLVPVGDVMRGRFNPEADRPILMICAVGGRSYVAGRVMTARGYREVYNLEGGIESWRKAGLPIETGPEETAN